MMLAIQKHRVTETKSVLYSAPSAVNVVTRARATQGKAWPGFKPRRFFGPPVGPPLHPYLANNNISIPLNSDSDKTYLSLLSIVESMNGEYGSMEDEDRPDYMNERVFQRNRLPPRAYFLPAEHLSLSGKWRFHYASSPLELEPDLLDDGAWDLIDVPGKLDSSKCSFEGQAPPQLVICEDRSP